MAQSVELLLDPVSDSAVRAEWDALHAARLPSERRSPLSEHHAPHITLYAGEDISAGTDAALSAELAGLDLALELGAVTFFGPHRGRYVCVHQVVPSVELLALQSRVAAKCGADPGSHFAPGRWTPHVTLARRVAVEQASAVLEVVAALTVAGSAAGVTRCRRWDGTVKDAWLL